MANETVSLIIVLDLWGDHVIQLSVGGKRLKENICTEFQMKNARGFNKIECYIKVG